jgi:predicted membrane protein
MNLTKAPRGSVFALMLIVAGALLFLDNLGILPIRDIGAYWPIFIVVWGASILERWRSPVAIVWALALMAWGMLLILGNLQIISVRGGVGWPVMLIALGATMLVRPLQLREWRERFLRFQAGRRPRSAGQSFFGNRLRESTVFGSMNRRLETQHFEGGKVEAVFGSIELDLSEAAISSAERLAVLEVNAVFGGIEVTVPRTWRVLMKSAAVFGGCDDRTVPPRPEPGSEPVTLVITGAAVFGGIEIRNLK